MPATPWLRRIHFGRRARVLVLVLASGLMAAGALAAVSPKIENPHGRFKGDCGLCHGSDGWKPEKISPAFNHASYGFPLSGAHSAAKCMACHASLDFTQGRQLCASCHQDPHRGEMGSDCSRCHSARSFTDRSAMVRQHQSTRFPLTGSHAQIDCEGCHKPSAQGKMQFVGTKAECQNCHMEQYKSTTNPDHQAGGFPLDCASCHTTLTWGTKSFDHDKTAFPLTGAHQSTACQACHGDGVYKGKSTDCYGCHKKDYDGATSPAHASAGFPTTCLQCHTTATWAGAKFDHNTQTSFPLTGAHNSAQCSGCHGDGVYKGKATACYSCHKTDYDGTADPKHGAAAFATACESCHTTANWTGATFNHTTQTTFPLTGAHSALDCNQCHGDYVFKGKSTLCYACHTTDYNGTTNPAHKTGGFPTACESCHGTNNWTSSTFNHNTSTKFALTGAHTSVACNQCHGDGVYAGKSMLCYSCHADKYTTPVLNHAAAAFATTCENCHTTTAWNPGAFNHSTSTTFPLSGAHPAVACSGCHGDNVFKGKNTLCYSCHQADYTGATNPAHATAGFPTTCESCHGTANWTSSTFNHNTSTTFPLTGAHQAVACNGCHGDNVFKGKSTLCYSCHADKYTTPVLNHAAAAFATTCESCHSTTAWNPGTFNHTTSTTFPLTGAHPAVACNQCHGDNVFKGKSALCYSCHQADYTATTNPAHQSGGFPTTCETCHGTTNWTSSTFNHNTSTTFPLTGAHQAVACNGCHGDAVYKGKSTLCYSCHADKYATPVLNHMAAAFATTCENCHTTTAWNPGAFNHSTSTTFPLTGAHPAVACSGCHGDNVYKGKSTLCYSCHKTDYDGTNSPPHASSGISTACESCHTTTDWGSGSFDHNTQTTFPLTGAHLAVACSGCHGDNVYKGKSTLCYSCHRADYTGATNPAHASAGFPTNCETCHSTSNWTSSTFNHNTSTTFPLTGAHQAVACNGCHGDNVYKGKSTLCVSCHQADFNGTTDPKHSAATTTFVSTCESCHNTTTWTTATFNHSTATTFPLTGAHITLDCNSCHGDNVYKGKSTLCYACHQADYNTTVVNHPGAGFGTACETCHTTTAWSGGKFTAHDTQFRIYSGRHLGKWSNCTDCHTSTTNYTVFACYGPCHNVSTVDGQHGGVSGYVKGAGDSQKCYSCHRSV
jgi:hypothetical protein